ncbi:MAG: prepilin-type N-terminal cleavage/methylation domain-containing protein [Kiritimatiellia bacterium]
MPMNRAKGNLFRAGFTLIEIMVAMSVLAILVMLIGNIFQQVSASWNIGTHSADANTAARAALNYMAQELSQAVAGPVEAAPGVKDHLQNLSFEVLNGEDVRFFTLTGDVNRGSDRRGALRQSAFYWDHSDNLLRCARQTNRDESYTRDPDHSAAPKELIWNVVDFWMCVYTNRADFKLNQGWVENITLTNSLPVCIDIYLSILGEGDMARYMALSGDAQDEFRESNAQCYSTRVYFLNRQGYAAR